jgi:serine/threonine-protein kinase RsbW
VSDVYKAIKLEISSRLENVALLGLAVRSLCLTTLNEVAANEVELAVVEATNNCIEHAYAGECWHRIGVVFSLNEQGVTIEIRDTGKSMNEHQWGDAKNAQSPQVFMSNVVDLPEGGMGWFIINSLINEVSYTSQDNTNTLILTKHREV